MQPNSQKHWSRGQLESVPHCPACGCKKPASAVFTRRDNEGFMPDQWQMLLCSDCQSIWLNPRPDAESLPRAYDNYYTHHADADDIPPNNSSGLAWSLIYGYLNCRFGMHRRPANRLGYPLFSLIEPWRLKLDYYGRHLTDARVGAPGRLLDIGCGNGAFLARALDMGWEVEDCEVDPKAVEACRNIGINVIEGDAFAPDLGEQSFDVVMMSHVIEHVYDPPSVLKRAYDLLRPGGWFWMACSNPSSTGRKTFGSAWIDFHPPCHIIIPSQKILVKWLGDNGFINITPLRRGAHVRQRWGKSKKIAQRDGIKIFPSSILFIIRLVADLMSTFSPRCPEETVLLAQKPK